MLHIIALLLVLKCICLEASVHLLGHHFKCFFNESEEFCLVDGRDGALVSTDL